MNERLAELRLRLELSGQFKDGWWELREEQLGLCVYGTSTEDAENQMGAALDKLLTSLAKRGEKAFRAHLDERMSNPYELVLQEQSSPREVRKTRSSKTVSRSVTLLAAAMA